LLNFFIFRRVIFSCFGIYACINQYKTVTVTNYENYEVEDFLHDDFFIDWVLKSTEEHERFWNEWLLSYPDRKQVVESARRVVASIAVKPLDTSLSDNEVEDIVAYVKNQLHDQEVKAEPVLIHFYRSVYFQAAAVLLVFMVISFLFIKTNNQHSSSNQVTAVTDAYVRVRNISSESKVVRMSDGSLAVLKPGSALRYLRSFAKQRQVYLDGEAFFEVHKNPGIPFLVHSNDMVVRVLGTSFTVRTQKDKQKFNVIVNTGKVLVYNHKTAPDGKGKGSVTLMPNQQLVYQSTRTGYIKETLQKPLTLSLEIAKKEFTFDNVPFSTIVEKINKVYDVNIEYDKSKLGNIVLNASLSDRPLDAKVELICKAVNATCEFTDGRIIITAPGK
jgi:transmembrane sensor